MANDRRSQRVWARIVHNFPSILLCFSLFLTWLPQPIEAASANIPSSSSPLSPAPAPPLSPAPLPYLLLPDSEVVYSPTAAGFDPAAYLRQTRGYLRSHKEYLQSTGWTSAADIVKRVALEYSINPRLLLALLEYQCRCVLGPLQENMPADYLLGMQGYHQKGLYLQLSWAARELSAGYYGWRSGSLKEIRFSDGIISRPAVDLNPGSVAVEYFFSRLYTDRRWAQAIDARQGYSALYARMFGNPWQSTEPVLPEGLAQPELSLPFEPGKVWSFISGPHTVWDEEGAQAALDFAPAVPISGCVQTDAWVIAMADGWVVRSEFNSVVQDLAPSDRQEQTGWDLLYFHIADRDRTPAGVFLHAGDRIGHPSCEGGRANGTHVHIARKYNGEWIPAAGPLPFALSGWVAHAGSGLYKGSLMKDGRTVIANTYGASSTFIVRQESNP